MTDASISTKVDWSGSDSHARRRKRYAADRRLQIYGIVAIGAAVGLLAILLATIILRGYPAFVQTHIRVDFPISTENVDPANPADGNFRNIVRDGIAGLLPEVDTPREQRAMGQILTNNTQFFVRDAVVSDPSVIGGTLTLAIPASDIFDQLQKGVISRTTPEANRRVTDQQIEWFDELVASGRVSTPFNWGLIFNSDSRFPEIAGLAGAIVGTFYAVLVCFVISFPIGIAAAVYLEEFAPKNRWTDLIEVNINNLAAVPSIVFGLLGLAVFLDWFGLAAVRAARRRHGAGADDAADDHHRHPRSAEGRAAIDPRGGARHRRVASTR